MYCVRALSSKGSESQAFEPTPVHVVGTTNAQLRSVGSHVKLHEETKSVSTQRAVCAD
jgi:hypothetical protein